MKLRSKCLNLGYQQNIFLLFNVKNASKKMSYFSSFWIAIFKIPHSALFLEQNQNFSLGHLQHAPKNHLGYRQKILLPFSVRNAMKKTTLYFNLFWTAIFKIPHSALFLEQNQNFSLGYLQHAPKYHLG